MATDITKQKRFEQTMSESPELLSRIISSVMDAIIAIDDSQRIVLFNAAAEKMFRCPANEAMGNSIEHFIPQRFRGTHSTHVRHFGEMGVITRAMGTLGTKWGLRTTGEEFPIEASISKVESGGKRFFTVVIRDITERHRAEEAVRESEQRFRLLADTAPVLIWMSGTDKLCTYFNKPWLDFTGRSIDQELGNGWAEGVHPDELQRCLDTYQQSFDRREKFEMEYRLRRHNGEYRWVLDVGVPRFNQDRSFAGYVGIAIDVTERKLADEARFRLAVIVESSEDAIISKTLDGVIVSWNKGAQQIFGYTAAEAVGKPITILVPTELREEENKILERLGAGERIEQFEMVRVTKTGKRINVSLSISPIQDSSGAIVGASGIARDISDRKRHEERLREYERAVENAEEMIAVVDREYRYLIANRQFLKMRNKRQEQVVGRFVHEVLNKGVFDGIVKPKLDKCFQGQIVRYEMKYTYPELGERDLLVSYFPIEGANGIDRAASIIQDITDRKRSEESLRESEERFRLAAQAGRMYSYEWDVTTDVLVRSAEYVEILGVTEPQRFTRQQFMDKIHPDDRPRFIAAIAGLTPENPTRDVTYRVLLPGGAFLWLKNSGRAFFDGEGRMLRVIGMVADVTDQKLAEEALADMSRKLVEAQEHERARIARELHDDINQRLAMLSVELEQLRDDPSEFRSRVQELRKQTTEISNDVQALSHDLHSSPLEYLGAVAGMKSWCREFGDRQGMQINCRHDVRSTLPQEVGLCLFRVVQEALHNAAKHSGVKRIEVQLREEAGEIHLTVTDSGQGFDMEAARKGQGLGLTSMQERVRLVNGTIDIQSTPMRGTTIHVRVPLKSEHVRRQMTV